MSVSAPSVKTAHRRGERAAVRCGPLVHGGVCLASLDDGTSLFVEHAIPGELVEVTLRFRKGRTWFAEASQVLEPSAQRVEPPCPYVPECGGCQLQHIGYEHQTRLKLGVVADALRRQGIAMPRDTRMHAAHEPWRYRIRGELHVVPGSRGVADSGLGFNRSRSWRPIAVDDCLIHDRSITDSLPSLREMVRSRGTDELRTLRLTAGDGGAELLVDGHPGGALPVDAIGSLSLPHTRASTEWTTLRWRGGTYRVRSDTFVQVNWTQMDVLYQRALDGLGDYAGARIVDAYAGIGVLACYLATDAREVVCVESNRAAVRTGILNARLNEVAARVRYVARTVESALPEVAASGPIDAVILDPPRAGCDGRVTAWLALAGPPRIVYVSCDPATLARDLHVLVASGPYELASLDVVDMFPHSYHIESVVSLVRSSNPVSTSSAP